MPTYHSIARGAIPIVCSIGQFTLGLNLPQLSLTVILEIHSAGLLSVFNFRCKSSVLISMLYIEVKLPSHTPLRERIIGYV
jgi:hypothetical protein